MSDKAPKINSPNFIIPGTELDRAPADDTARGLGESALLSTEMAPKNTSEDSKKNEYTEEGLERLLKSLTVSEPWAIENGYTEVFPVEHRIFEPTGAPGYGNVRNRLAHVLWLGEDMVFVKKDGGFEPRLKLQVHENI